MVRGVGPGTIGRKKRDVFEFGDGATYEVKVSRSSLSAALRHHTLIIDGAQCEVTCWVVSGQNSIVLCSCVTYIPHSVALECGVMY
jgi:hypothetical protein